MSWANLAVVGDASRWPTIVGGAARKPLGLYRSTNTLPGLRGSSPCVVRSGPRSRGDQGWGRHRLGELSCTCAAYGTNPLPGHPSNAVSQYRHRLLQRTSVADLILGDGDRFNVDRVPKGLSPSKRWGQEPHDISPENNAGQLEVLDSGRLRCAVDEPYPHTVQRMAVGPARSPHESVGGSSGATHFNVLRQVEFLLRLRVDSPVDIVLPLLRLMLERMDRPQDRSDGADCPNTCSYGANPLRENFPQTTQPTTDPMANPTKIHTNLTMV